MQPQSQFVEGDTKARIALALLAVLSVGLFFYLQAIISDVLVEVQLLLGADPEMAILLAGRLLLWLVIFSGAVAVAIGVYLIVLAGRVDRSGLYPPPGMPVAFRTELKRDQGARQMARVCRWAGVLLCCQPLLGLYVWFSLMGGA